MAKVLIVEDDKTLCDSLSEWLQSDRFNVEFLHTGGEVLDYLRSFDFDLIVLDWDLPGLSGVDICRQFRAAGGSTPILMLTGKTSVQNKTEGFDAGADDYLTKPFHPEELAARLSALLRRPKTYTGAVISLRDVVLDTNKRQVTQAGVEVPLQPMEFTLLEFFMRHPDQTFSTELLMRRCWESDAEISLDSVYTCVRRLRRKLDANGRKPLIVTVHGVGYRLHSE